MLAKAAAVVQKDFLTAVRYRNGMFLTAFAPTMQLLLSFYLAHSVGPQYRPDGISYFSFLLVGTGLFMFLHSCMHGFLNVIQESQQAGTLEVLMTTSTPPVTLLCLAAVSAIGTALLQFVLYIALGLCFLPSQFHIAPLAAAAVLLLSVSISIAFGILAAGLQLSMQKGSVILWLFGTTAWVFAGTLFPVGSLPEPLRVLSQWMPLTHSLTAMRLAMFGGAGTALLREIAVLLAFALLLLPASAAFFSWTLRRARQLGTLSFY
jgi:ABC-2 type transport system permease protein